MQMDTLGKRIRQLRIDNKLNQDRFGELCDVSKGAVSQWETDQTIPELGKLLELHKKIQFSFDCLLIAGNTNQPPVAQIAGEPVPLPYVHSHAIVRQVIALMEATDDAGKGIILMAAHQALEKYRPVKETAASSQ